MRNGFRLIDATGTLAGTIAVVFIRREYGRFENFRTIVDIGANMGSFALYAAISCPEAKIFCYEPVAENYGFLKRNLAINSLEKRVAAFQYAVAARSGRREIALGTSPTHSLLGIDCSAGHRLVECITLGDIINSQHLETVDLLKVNCEGAEYEILESCSRAELDHFPNIRLEYHNLDAFKRNGGWLSRFLESRRYKIESFSKYRDESGIIWARRAK